MIQKLLLIFITFLPALGLAEFRIADSELSVYLPGRPFTVELPGNSFGWKHKEVKSSPESTEIAHSFKSQDRSITVIVKLTEAACSKINVCHEKNRLELENIKNQFPFDSMELKFEDSTYKEYFITSVQPILQMEAMTATTIIREYEIAFFIVVVDAQKTDPINDFLKHVQIRNSP